MLKNGEKQSGYSDYSLTRYIWLISLMLILKMLVLLLDSIDINKKKAHLKCWQLSRISYKGVKITVMSRRAVSLMVIILVSPLLLKRLDSTGLFIVALWPPEGPFSLTLVMVQREQKSKLTQRRCPTQNWSNLLSAWLDAKGVYIWYVRRLPNT